MFRYELVKKTYNADVMLHLGDQVDIWTVLRSSQNTFPPQFALF